MKKQLPEELIANELKGHSSFFRPPIEQILIPGQFDRVRTPEHMNTGTGEQANEWTDERANTRTDAHMNGRAAERSQEALPKRAIKRQSYNVYLDQHQTLQRLEATSILSGKAIFISEMVRQALDEYLQKHFDTVRTNEHVNR